MEFKLISSLQNPLVKDVVKLSQKSNERKTAGLFVVEGIREVSLALQSGIKVRHLFICEHIYKSDDSYPIEIGKYPTAMVKVNPEVYAKIAYRGSAEGILAIFESFDTKLQNLNASENSIFIVLESVEKPGNLGAILRTADAAGVDGVIICDPQTDVFNPNVIRSSLGCLFTVKIAVCDRDEYFRWATTLKLSTKLASVQATDYYYKSDLKGPLSLVFGTEAEGLSADWYEHAHEKLKIPMEGMIDSLNVAASVAIMVFEAKRQRSNE
jgi:RNA methyltransferase, TrmH family